MPSCEMLVTRAPVRVSFGGGGTDLPAFYMRHGGMVLSTSVSYHSYAILTPGSTNGAHIVSADYHTLGQRPPIEDLIWEGDLSLPKAVTYYLNVPQDVSIFLAAQIPPGTGLGSSGSMTVALVKALAFWYGLDLGPGEVAELACYIEIEKLGMPVGKQDQYAAAFGGLNCITFEADGVTVEPVTLEPDVWSRFESSLMLFFTGTSRQSSTILRQQRQASEAEDPETIKHLMRIKALGQEMRTVLERGALEDFAGLLHASWLQKRQVAKGITNPDLDRYYAAAREAGALGGKVTGAGGGGFLLLYCPEPDQLNVVAALSELGLRRWPLRLDREGVQVLQAQPAFNMQPMAGRVPNTISAMRD